MSRRSVWLFPGQGSQHVGMGRKLYEAFREVKDVYDEADDILGFSIAGLSFKGPDEQLVETRNAQPALFVLSAAISQLLISAASPPEAAAGHSLGEYSAFYSAGAFSFDEALRIVRLRGELMYSSGLARPGAMAAVIGLSGNDVEDVCRKYEGDGEVCAANFNSPNQSVISGDETAVRNIVDDLKQAGARLVKRLHVSGAFHSSLMEPASEELSRRIDEVEFEAADFPVVVNASAEFTDDPADIAASLKDQLTSPVLWHRSMEKLNTLEPDIFVESGAGSVLGGLMKRINKSSRVLAAGTPAELESAISEIIR